MQCNEMKKKNNNEGAAKVYTKPSGNIETIETHINFIQIGQ